MCFTGGFALATALEPSVVASVMSQPAMPAPIGERGRAARVWMPRTSPQSRHERMTTCACSGSGSPTTGVARRSDSRPYGRRLGILRGDRDRLVAGQRGGHRAVGARGSGSPSSTSRGIRPGSPSTGSWRSWPSGWMVDPSRRGGCRGPAQSRLRHRLASEKKPVATPEYLSGRLESRSLWRCQLGRPRRGNHHVVPGSSLPRTARVCLTCRPLALIADLPS